MMVVIVCGPGVAEVAVVVPWLCPWLWLGGDVHTTRKVVDTT